MITLLFTFEQLENFKKEYLELVGDECFKFTGQGKASKDLKEKLIKKDKEWVNVFGYHLITNYKDLEI